MTSTAGLDPKPRAATSAATRVLSLLAEEATVTTTIMPVVEEVVVVERRLILKEEIRIRRVRTMEHHRETVALRTQDAVITRVEAGLQATGDDRRSFGTDSTPLAQEQAP